MSTRALAWRKSSRSGSNGGGCVEVAELPERIMVRDSKDPAGPRLVVGREEWRSFLAAIR